MPNPSCRPAARIGAVLLCMAAGLAHAGTAYFSGTVTDSHGAPRAGITVKAGYNAFDAQGAHFAVDGQAVSDAQGHYAITALDSANTSGYYILALDTNGYVLTAYPGKQCADASCFLHSGLIQRLQPPMSGVDFVAVAPATLEGQVTFADVDQPAPNLLVDLVPAGQQLSMETLITARTDASGQYSITTLPPGSYTVSTFNIGETYLGQAYPLIDLDTAYPFNQSPTGSAVVANEGQVTSGIDLQLHRPAFITGTFTSALNSAPVAADIYVRHLTPIAAGSFVKVGEGTGDFRVGPLAAGTYRVAFGRNDDYTDVYYPQALDESGAATITLVNGQTVSGLDASLTPTRTISGRVTDASSGLPLAGVPVHALRYISVCPIVCPFNDESDAVTDASGHYVLQGLDQSSGADSHYVTVAPPSTYIGVMYPNAVPCCVPNQFSVPAGAVPLALGTNEAKTGIDFALSKGAFATGKIYDPDTGYGVPSDNVVLTDLNGNIVGSVFSDSTGHYVMPAVAPGNYRLYTLGTGNAQVFYPNFVCAPCNPITAPILTLGSPVEFPSTDFVFPHFDLVFRNNFD